MEHFRNEDNNIDFMVSYFSTTFNKANSVSALFPKSIHIYICMCMYVYACKCYKGQEIEYDMV